MLPASRSGVLRVEALGFLELAPHGLLEARRLNRWCSAAPRSSHPSTKI